MSNSRTNVDLLRSFVNGQPTLHGTITLGTSPADTINQVGQATGRAASAPYTPTLTSGANVASTTLRGAWYQRHNEIVSVTVVCDIDPIAGSVGTVINISLPVASNFTSLYEASGIGLTQANELGVVSSDSTNDNVTYVYLSAGTGSTLHRIQFSYRVL